MFFGFFSRRKCRCRFSLVSATPRDATATARKPSETHPPLSPKPGGGGAKPAASASSSGGAPDDEPAVVYATPFGGPSVLKKGATSEAHHSQAVMGKTD